MPRLPFDGEIAITQHFGERHPRYTDLGLLGHNGVDFACPDDTPIFACADGECIESWSDPDGYGFYVKLRTPEGADWLYAHLHPWMLPRPGTWCPEGSLLGYSDNSGMSTGPHLHLGYRPQWWRRGGAYDGYADPLPLIFPG
jgi:murein DD-endopeptidase MepM/ murein hydrolase activator NlpD